MGEPGDVRSLNHARSALAALDHLGKQDLFLTETAAYADVILPASGWAEKDGTVSNTDRRVQLGRGRATRRGARCLDIRDIANGLGMNWSTSTSPRYEEMRGAAKYYRYHLGSFERAEFGNLPFAMKRSWPGRGVQGPVPTGNGKARLRQRKPSPPTNNRTRLSVDLITGRQLEHWHTGTMTRRANVLDAIEPVPVVRYTRDLVQLGIDSGDSTLHPPR